MSTAAWTIAHRRIEEEVIPGMRLGRNIRRDSRDAAYPYRGDPQRTLADQLWARHLEIFDQDGYGSCTGEAEEGLLATDPFFAALPAGVLLSQAGALKLYSEAEIIDGGAGLPSEDDGSSGQSASQAAKNDGLISGYTHAADVNEMAAALQDGPVIVGVSWYSSFDSPASSGLIAISKGAYVRGGHEFLVRGVKVSEKLFLADNSWGSGWGLKGSMELTWDTMARLFGEEGDCTVSVPLTAPAPVPVPVPPVPADPDSLLWSGGPSQRLPGGLKAWAAEHRVREDLRDLQADARAWAQAHGYAL